MIHGITIGSQPPLTMPGDNCPGQDQKHDYRIIQTLGCSLPKANITLSFDIKSERVYCCKTRIKCNIETGYYPSNQAFKATVIWEPNHHCRVFKVGRLNARMMKFQKQYYFETLTKNETNSGQQQCRYVQLSRPSL